jgi:hypothetical protein
MNMNKLRELAGLPTLNESTTQLIEGWCLVDSQTNEVLSQGNNKDKLIAKQEGKYGQTSTEISWGYANEDGEFVEVEQVSESSKDCVNEEYHDTSDFDAAINEVLDHLHAAQKLVNTPAWKQHMVDAVHQGAPKSTVATNRTMTTNLGTLIDSYVALYESFEDL